MGKGRGLQPRLRDADCDLREASGKKHKAALVLRGQARGDVVDDGLGNGRRSPYDSQRLVIQRPRGYLVVKGEQGEVAVGCDHASKNTVRLRGASVDDHDGTRSAVSQPLNGSRDGTRRAFGLHCVENKAWQVIARWAGLGAGTESFERETGLPDSRQPDYAANRSGSGNSYSCVEKFPELAKSFVLNPGEAAVLLAAGPVAPRVEGAKESRLQVLKNPTGDRWVLVDPQRDLIGVTEAYLFGGGYHTRTTNCFTNASFAGLDLLLRIGVGTQHDVVPTLLQC